MLWKTLQSHGLTKIQDKRQIKNTDVSEPADTKSSANHNPEKENKTKHSKTKLTWFSRLLRHSTRKQGGLILYPTQMKLR